MNDELMIDLVKSVSIFLTIDRLLGSFTTIILSVVETLAPISTAVREMIASKCV